MNIVTDVIDCDLPLLLSRSAMQKAGTKIDFRRDKVTTFGKEQDLHFTTSGHYCIPLNHYCEINSDISKFNQERTILFTTNLGSKSVKEERM